MTENVENLSSPNPPSEIKETSQSTPKGKIQIKFSLVDKWKEIMKKIKEKTGIEGIYVIIFLAICVILVYFGIFESLITSLVGTLYPGFSTIKAIQKKKNKKDWLTYWVIFGSFLIFDMFSNIINKFFPYYFVVKIIFLIWMFLPGSNGCQKVYNILIVKILKALVDLFDRIFEEGNQVKKEIIGKVGQIGQGLMKAKGFNKKMQQIKESQMKNQNNSNNNTVFTSALNISTSHKKLEVGYNKEEIEAIKEDKKEDKIEEKKEDKKEDKKEEEEHINLDKKLDDILKSCNEDSNNKAKEDKNKPVQLSFLELDD